jgi:hypothetical protein
MSYKNKYKSFTEIIASIINKLDPIGLLKNGAPKDEYYGEIQKIATLVKRRKDKIELGKLIQNIFVESFDEETAGNIDIYLEAAENILREIIKDKGVRPSDVR